RLDYERDLLKLQKMLEAISANSSDARRALGEKEEERAAGASVAKLRKIQRTTASKTAKMTAAYERAQQALDAMLAKYKIPADPSTGDVFGIAADGTAAKNPPPAGMLGGKRMATSSAAGSGTPPAGTLGGRRVRVRSAGRVRPASAPRVGRLPAAETLGGVKV